MKYLSLLVMTFMATVLQAQQPVISHVITHNMSVIVCDPSAGVRSFAAWGVFPPSETEVRKIIMHVTLGSPDSIMTAHWDYLDHIRILRQGGAKGTMSGYELGRMLTPYGSVFGKGWSWEWDVDVTDFAPFLRDSVEIEYTHSGYEATDVGWALTIDFEITEGPPVAQFLGITPLWNGGFRYGDPAERIEETLLPIPYTAPRGTAVSRIRIQHTGHGMDRPGNCSEFCSRWRQIELDGNIADRRDMWKDCGDNPLYPQGGTWIYDRAYWCPGDLQQPDVIDVTSAPGNHLVKMTMEPYTATENIQAVENISAYLFHYSAPVEKDDAAVEKIIVPTDRQQYSRFNPACYVPRMVVRNLGANALRSLLITYGTDGYASRAFKWKGNLAFNQTAIISLPGEIDFSEGSNRFTVVISKPNGVSDGWRGDNKLTSSFTSPRTMPAEFVSVFKTNRRPSDNSIFIVSENADTVFKHIPSLNDTDRIFIDTIRLDRGKFEFFLADTAGDGLEFWAEPQFGEGYLRLFDMNDNLIHSFESDCGNGEMLSFVADPEYITDTVTPKYAFSLYPRLVRDRMDLSMVSNHTSDMTVVITVGGTVFERHEYHSVKNTVYTYNLSYMPAGRIVVEVFMDGVSRFKGRVNKIKERR